MHARGLFCSANFPNRLSHPALDPRGNHLGIGLLHGEWSIHRQRATVGNHHIVDRAVTTVGFGLFDLADDVHSLQHLAEHDVASVQPAGLLDRDEELRTVGVLAGVGHRQPSGSIVLQLEVLVSEALTVDRAASGSIATGEVSTLDHEVLDDAVELAALVAASR